MSANQQIITIDDISADNAPAIYVTGGLGRFLDAVTAEVTAEVPDLTTRKGRERIASLAAKVSKSKAAVEKPGRDYLKRLKEMPKVVETELREFVTKMDELRDKTRQPLTEWEAANDRRIDAHNDGIARIKAMGEPDGHEDSDEIEALIASLEAEEIGDSWEEFQPEALQAKDFSLRNLRPILAALRKREADQAELARLRVEAEARAKADHDAAIARAAVEKAQQEAAATAQAEREEAARREQALIDQAAQAKRDAEQKARDAEAVAANQALQLQLAAEQAERQKIQAEADRVAAIQRAEQERVAAEKRQAAAVEQARLAEIARQEAAAAEEKCQAEAREADKAHKGKINRAALQAFIEGGMPEDCAKKAVILIASRQIPNITITY